MHFKPIPINLDLGICAVGSLVKVVLHIFRGGVDYNSIMGEHPRVPPAKFNPGAAHVCYHTTRIEPYVFMAM